MPESVAGTNRIVCIVEGHGENLAAPVLCSRVLRGLLAVEGWYVERDAIRWSRSKIVDESVASPRRPAHTRELSRALALAAARSPKGVLLLCDADDDCPASFGRPMPTSVPAGRLAIPVRGVMASREYESWLLWARPDAEREKARAADPERAPRDAKKALAALVPGYSPTSHQELLTRAADLGAIWARSDSFDKLVRSIATLVGAAPPKRPTVKTPPPPRGKR